MHFLQHTVLFALALSFVHVEAKKRGGKKSGSKGGLSVISDDAQGGSTTEGCYKKINDVVIVITTPGSFSCDSSQMDVQYYEDCEGSSCIPNYQIGFNEYTLYKPGATVMPQEQSYRLRRGCKAEVIVYDQFGINKIEEFNVGEYCIGVKDGAKSAGEKRFAPSLLSFAGIIFACLFFW